MSNITNQQLERLLALLAESKRLEILTPRQLVFETLGKHVADDLHVVELMSRVLPQWEKQFTEEELES